MKDFNFDREDNINIKNIVGQIEIWLASAIMDDGTIFLNCRCKDKYLRIVSRQWTIITKNKLEDNKHFLYINQKVVKINSDEEKLYLG
jgi:hypothetical protein